MVILHATDPRHSYELNKYCLEKNALEEIAENYAIEDTGKKNEYKPKINIFCAEQ